MTLQRITSAVAAVLPAQPGKPRSTPPSATATPHTPPAPGAGSTTAAEPGWIETLCAVAAGGTFVVPMLLALVSGPAGDWQPYSVLCFLAILGLGLTMCLPILWRLLTLALSMRWELATLRTEAAARHNTVTALQGSVGVTQTETAACHRTVKALGPELRAIRAALTTLPDQLTPPAELPAPAPEPVEPEPVWRCLQPLIARDNRPPAVQVADRIHDAITARRLPPGTLLPPDAAIARHLHVSLTTVRNAKRRVLDTGAVQPTGRGRYLVSDIAAPGPNTAAGVQ